MAQIYATIDLKSIDNQNIDVFSVTDRQNAPCSIFGSVRSKDTARKRKLKIFDWIEIITDTSNTKLAELTKDLKAKKASGNLQQYKFTKETMCPGCIPGDWPDRAGDSCRLYVPLLLFDFDGIPVTFLSWYIDSCKKISYVFGAWPSPSGQGFRVAVWAASHPGAHKDFYQAICERLSLDLSIPTDKHLRDRWKAQGLTRESAELKVKETGHLDTSTSNLNRLWFFVYAPKDLFYLNWESDVFTLPDHVIDPEQSAAPIEKATTKKTQPNTSPSGKYKYEFTDQEKVLDLIRQIVAGRIDVTAGLENWHKVACAFVGLWGEWGRDYFHQVCQFHHNYKPSECDQEFTRALRKQNNPAQSTRNFYGLCTDFGLRWDFRQMMIGHPAFAGGNNFSTSKI